MWRVRIQPLTTLLPQNPTSPIQRLSSPTSSAFSPPQTLSSPAPAANVPLTFCLPIQMSVPCSALIPTDILNPQDRYGIPTQLIPLPLSVE